MAISNGAAQGKHSEASEGSRGALKQSEESRSSGTRRPQQRRQSYLSDFIGPWTSPVGSTWSKPYTESSSQPSLMFSTSESAYRLRKGSCNTGTSTSVSSTDTPIERSSVRISNFSADVLCAGCQLGRNQKESRKGPEGISEETSEGIGRNTSESGLHAHAWLSVVDESAPVRVRSRRKYHGVRLASRNAAV